VRLNQLPLYKREVLISLSVFYLGILYPFQSVELLFRVVKTDEIIFKLLFSSSLVIVPLCDLVSYSPQILEIICHFLLPCLFLYILVFSNVLQVVLQHIKVGLSLSKMHFLVETHTIKYVFLTGIVSRHLTDSNVFGPLVLWVGISGAGVSETCGGACEAGERRCDD
jgi:hypothetical protein